MVKAYQRHGNGQTPKSFIRAATVCLCTYYGFWTWYFLFKNAWLYRAAHQDACVCVCVNTKCKIWIFWLSYACLKFPVYTVACFSSKRCVWVSAPFPPIYNVFPGIRQAPRPLSGFAQACLGLEHFAFIPWCSRPPHTWAFAWVYVCAYARVHVCNAVCTCYAHTTHTYTHTRISTSELAS